jgi:hypothetical protein
LSYIQKYLNCVNSPNNFIWLSRGFQFLISKTMKFK